MQDLILKYQRDAKYLTAENIEQEIKCPFCSDILPLNIDNDGSIFVHGEEFKCIKYEYPCERCEEVFTTSKSDTLCLGSIIVP